MIIAVNTRIISANPASANLLQTCFEEIARLHPEHFFAFISNRPVDGKKEYRNNITHHLIQQESANPLLWKIWYNYKLPSLLRKIKADVLINADGICSLRTKLPQLVFLHELISSKQQGWYNKKYQRFMLANQQAFLQKATHILAVNKVLQHQLVQQYQIDNGKISILYPGIDDRYQPIEWEQKDQVKEQYTGGKDYFLYAGTLQQRNNLISLLKAFSFFKRRQKSNMQLVIAAENIDEKDDFTVSLETYKYRREVVLLKQLPAEESVKITAAAYAFLSPAWQEINYGKLLNAMQCRVPVLVSNNEINKELFGNAGLYADADSFEDIADKMMLLFKDEDKRTRLIEQGKLQLQNYSTQKNATSLWKNIMAAIQ